jgi:crotonobetainyl-CoA:carnitine CoA-transferase CaiB-like acyl-CoA transferase
MSFTGEPGGGPLRFPIAIADMTTGMYSAMGILGALFARERGGKGEYLDMALFDSQLTWLANVGSSYLNAGVSPHRWGNAHPNIVPYQLFRGNDGRYFVVGVGTQDQWRRLVEILRAGELGSDARFANNAARNQNREQLIPILQRQFDSLPSGEWLAKLKGADIPATPIQTVSEALGDCQTQARGLVVEMEHPTLQTARSIANPIRFSEQAIIYRLPPPLLGEHSKSILGELGYSDSEAVAALKEACRAGS